MTWTDREIGELCASLRKQRGLSQGQLVEIINATGLRWHQTTLTRVETGDRGLRVKELPCLAEALGISVPDMLRFTTGPREAVLLARLSAARRAVADAEDEERKILDELQALGITPPERRAGGAA